MPNDYLRINYLLQRYAENNCSLNELRELMKAMRDLPEENHLDPALLTIWQQSEDALQVPGLDKESIYQKIIAVPVNNGKVPVRRVISLKWLRTAAAVLLLVTGGGIWLWFNRATETPRVAINAPVPVNGSVVSPGGNKAILTLADGSVIVLDSAANGSVASQGNSRIVKLYNGKLAYNSNLQDTPGDVLMYNTISTPRGGQYQVVLPDGSKVWLNANSSIRFPAIFAAGERKVEVTGEVYFEVAKDERSPFNVKAGDATVQVLGTNFNINAYNDEAIMQTTLLAGSVKVSYGSASGVMTPGQSAKMAPDNKERLIIGDDPGALNSIAWVNGFFHFEKADITTVMRQLSRWYDIDVEIRTPKNANLDKFGGDIERNLPLTSVLKILESSQVHFKLENKKLIVMP